MKLIFSFFIFSLSALFSGNQAADETAITEPDVPHSDYITFINSKNAWTESKLAEMTLREKIAQMIVSYSNGYDISESSADFQKVKNLIVNEKIGGVIFFKGNANQQASLINKFQSLSETPLLISADYERGTKMRLENGSLFPNNMGVGATRNPDLAYKMGLQIAKECRAMGVHQNYAPVMDVNNNPNNPIINVRSFGEDPQLVSQMGDMMIKGLQEGNVIATAKHFPGHGDTDIDSHSDLPVLNFDSQRLNNLELIPFKSAIQNDVMSVMIAHLSFPAFDSEQHIASSLSPAIVTGLLKNDMGYKGLIVTDALNMAGITKHFSNQDVALRCVKAGIDLILMPLDEPLAISTIEDAVNSGVISQERIEESARKILNAKKWLGLDKNKMVDESIVSQVVNSPEAQAISQQIADESITLVSNKTNLLPFNTSGKKCLIVSLNNGNETANSQLFFSTFEKMNTFAEASSYDLTGNITDAGSIVADADNFDVILIPIYAKVKMNSGTVGIPQSQLKLINDLVAKGKEVAVISFGNPYLVQGFSGVPSYVCAYGDGETSINAALKAVFGAVKFKGKLPVSVSSEYPYGTGITN